MTEPMVAGIIEEDDGAASLTVLASVEGVSLVWSRGTLTGDLAAFSLQPRQCAELASMLAVGGIAVERLRHPPPPGAGGGLTGDP